MSDDPKLSQRYRELPREEPPRTLDEKILAASRRAIHRRRGWYVPLAAAAAITLAVAVTLHVQHDRPGEEVDAVSPSMKVQETPKADRFTPDPKPPAANEPELAALEKRSQADVQRAPAPAAAPAEAPRAAGTRAEASRMMGQVASPDQELERIARLREAGRHEEADKALAEFRKRHPDYRIAPAMLLKVEKK